MTLLQRILKIKELEQNPKRCFGHITIADRRIELSTLFHLIYSGYTLREISVEYEIKEKILENIFLKLFKIFDNKLEE